MRGRGSLCERGESPHGKRLRLWNMYESHSIVENGKGTQ